MAIRTLLLTGANNHDWERSAPFCRDLLADHNFEVTYCTDPSAALEQDDLAATWDLIFVDYNGPEWSDQAKQNFVAAVRRGVGVCILHAADNAFPGWVEYEEMCALMWRKGTGHGQYHRFDVTVTDPSHPITKGLPSVLKEHPDELYHRLVHMHNTDYHVIADAYSAPETGGTGNREPMAVVKSYGEGRIFHCILGHVWKGGPMDTFKNPDFQNLLARGCQWAGTGTVAEG